MEHQTGANGKDLRRDVDTDRKGGREEEMGKEVLTVGTLFCEAGNGVSHWLRAKVRAQADSSVAASQRYTD